MEFSLVYLLYGFVERPLVFLHHWYVDGSRVFAHALVSLLERLDQTIAIRITLKFFFQPLYKDFTAVGRILGVIFRSARILIGLAVYLSVVGVFLVVYLAWLSVPPAIIYYAARNI